MNRFPRFVAVLMLWLATTIADVAVPFSHVLLVIAGLLLVTEITRSSRKALFSARPVPDHEVFTGYSPKGQNPANLAS